MDQKCSHCLDSFIGAESLLRHQADCHIILIKQEPADIAVKVQQTTGKSAVSNKEEPTDIAKQTDGLALFIKQEPNDYVEQVRESAFFIKEDSAVDVVEQTDGSVPGQQPKDEQDLKELILDCKESLNSLLDPRCNYCNEDNSGTEIKCEKNLTSGGKKYGCSECSCACSTPSELLTHLETHNPEKIFTCPECLTMFSYFWSLNYHLSQSHSQIRHLNCLECRKSCCLIQELGDSMSERTECCTDCPKSFSCGTCPSVSETSHTVTCEFCKVLFTSLSAYRSHIQSCTSLLKRSSVRTCACDQNKLFLEDKFLYNVCDKKPARRHMKVHTEEEPYSCNTHSCDLCAKKFHSFRPRTYHAWIHTGEKPYSCDFCETRFSRLSSKVSHMRVHTGEKPFSCDFCEKKFARQANKVEHMRVHTGEMPFSCDICKKKFRRQNKKVQHMEVHCGEKPYSCDLCKKTFTRKQKKIEHMWLHTGEKPYSCDLCKKRFTQHSAKVSHMRVHTGEKPYSCDLCEKKFAVKIMKAEHMRVHTGEKPFSCDVCKKQFMRKKNKVQHMRVHTISL